MISILKIAPSIINLGEKLFGYFTKKEENKNNNEADKELDKQVKLLDEQKKLYEESNKQNQERFDKLQKMSEESLNEINKNYLKS